jgi:hypothetical protein
MTSQPQPGNQSQFWILNVIFVISTPTLAKIRSFLFRNFLCVAQGYCCVGPKETKKEREKKKENVGAPYNV